MRELLGTKMPTQHSTDLLDCLGCLGQLWGNSLGACPTCGAEDSCVPFCPAVPPWPVCAMLFPFSYANG